MSGLRRLAATAAGDVLPGAATWSHELLAVGGSAHGAGGSAV